MGHVSSVAIWLKPPQAFVCGATWPLLIGRVLPQLGLLCRVAGHMEGTSGTNSLPLCICVQNLGANIAQAFQHPEPLKTHTYVALRRMCKHGRARVLLQELQEDLVCWEMPDAWAHVSKGSLHALHVPTLTLHSQVEQRGLSAATSNKKDVPCLLGGAPSDGKDESSVMAMWWLHDGNVLAMR